MTVNKHFTTIISTILLGVVLISCASKKSQVEKDLSPNVNVVVQYGAQNSVSSNVMIAFEKIIQDSRCPKDVTCIWEGDAEVGLALVLGTAIHRFTLHTNRGFAMDTTIKGKHIRMVSLEPYPVSTSEIKTEDYRVVLQVQ